MSSFIIDQAAEHEEDDYEYSAAERKRLKAMKDDSEDSSEEEEDDAEQLKKVSENFIDDNDEEGGDESDSDESDIGGKRKHEDSEEEDEISEDDLALIEENTGVKIKKKFKRLKRIDDDDDDDEEMEETESRTQTSQDMEEGEGSVDSPAKAVETDEDVEEEDDFIVGDDGKPIQKAKKKPMFADAGLETARDIFGCDFDYQEFEQYEDEYEDKEDEEEEDELDEDEEGEEREVKKKEKRKVVKKSIFEIFEPSELERSHLTDRDHAIRTADLPERFQTRQIPVIPSRAEGEDKADAELEEEAEWIHKHAFSNPCISDQESREEARTRSRKSNQMIQKIYNALDLMRNSTCEVPFIAFYRKEEVQPELNIHDLWKICQWDEKWCQARVRKNNLIVQYEKMRDFLQYLNNKGELQEFRPIDDEEIFEIRKVEKPEDLHDFYVMFLLYYSRFQEQMKEYYRGIMKEKSKVRRKVMKKVKVMRRKVKKKANIGDEDEETEAEKEDVESDQEEEEVETEVETEVEDEGDGDNNEDETDNLKKPIRRHEYELLRKAKIEKLVEMFGLTPKQFAENLRDSYQKHDVEQSHVDPFEEAQGLVSTVCKTPENVLEAAKRKVGYEISSEPLVRRTVREAYFERARINIRPTAKGMKVIDEGHNLYTMKYLAEKPVVDLKSDQFLKIKMGVEEGLITCNLSDTISALNSHNSLLNQMRQMYYKDEFSQVAQDWNDLRGGAVEFAYSRIINDLKRELSQRLLNESKGHVLEMCCRKLYNWLRVSPYNPGDFEEEDEDDWSTSNGFRVCSIAFEPDREVAAFGCCIDVAGDCNEYIRLPHLLKRKNSYNEREAMAKQSDLNKIKEFLLRKKPHVVVVGGESREALMVVDDLKSVLQDLEENEQFPKSNVELMENDFSKVYAVSKKGIQDFLDYPPLLRQAISLGRRLQDPLIEFSQLCNPDDEILNLKYHQFQDQLSPSELYNALATEFVNRTNEVGVDLNRAVSYPHTQNIVQFVCGLGPRKAHSLLKNIKQSNVRLENRNQLVMAYHMGPKVFINCAGFIKIDTNSLGDSDNYIEVLDSTRIHPEAYDWARKMAVDALEYEEEEGKPAEALEEILDSPERLSELDLEAFATELNNQGFGKKNITLYDIRHELNHRYKDFRQSYRSPNAEEIFNMLTKECPETTYIGKLIQATVIDFVNRRPKGEQLDNANPLRNEDTGLWQCPFCRKNDFPELSEVWNHFDAENCPGQAIGIRVRLDNGISGFINIKNLSDKTVTNPQERVKKYRLIHCRIIKIDPEKFSVELTSRTSDLQDSENRWKPMRDICYDYSTEEKDNAKEVKKHDKKRPNYHKRVISHASFKNIDFAEAEKQMESMDQGDAIIRPSSKGIDHLTVTWKVTINVFQHVDIREQNKQNDFSLGKNLWIASEEFEDLDEILARYIAPLAANARQILEYKYYKEYIMGQKDAASSYLKEEKQIHKQRTIPYVFSPVKVLPGKFLLSYLPRDKVIHEYVTVLQDGFRFRKHNFTALQSLLKWFKSNFRNISRPTATPMMGRTPHATPMLDSAAIHRVAQNMPPHMLHNLSSAATTPYGTPFSNYSNYAGTPYTPSGRTPMMTPYNPLTPRPPSNM